MEIGLSTLVWVLLALIVIKFWRNIVNLIGGLIWLGVFVLIAIFVVTNFTTLNIDRFVDISFYDDLRRADEEYLVEKKDTAFDTAVGVKDNINSIGTEDDAFKDGNESDSESNSSENESDDGKSNTEEDSGDSTESSESVANASNTNVRSLEESNLNFNDESRYGMENELDEETESEGSSSQTPEVSEEQGDSDSNNVSEDEVESSQPNNGLIGYDEVDDYLESEGNNMNEDTKNLVKNLSPYVSWEYSDGDWYIESTSDGIIIEEN